MKKYYLDTALDLAEQSDHSFRHGAVVVKDGKLVSTGYNKYKANQTNIKTRNMRNSMHAEECALRQLGSKKLCENGIMYVARIASYGPANSKPCDRCQKIMKAFGISKAIYTTETGYECIVIS